MPVRAFVDDSGSGGDSQYFVLGGFIADFDTWEAFSDAWADELSRSPALPVFKMAQANALNGHFDGWTELDRDRKVNALIGVIDRHELFQGTCAIRADDYKAVINPVLGGLFKGQYADPYLYAFTGIVGLMSAMEHNWLYAQRGVPIDKLVVFDDLAHTGQPAQRVDFVFDKGKKLTDREARTLYEESLLKVGLFENRLGRVDFEDDEVFVPLQAADLCAWQRRRRLCARAEGERPEYRRLRARQERFKDTILTRDVLTDTINAIAESLRKVRDAQA